MKKLPSYLKGLVESRARSAGDIERLENLRVLVEEELAAARRRQGAADVFILEFDPLLDPSLIQPIAPRRGRRGQLKATILEIVQETAPHALPSGETAFLVAQKTGLRFRVAADFRAWAKNSVYRQLLKLREVGSVDWLPYRGEETRWRATADGKPRSLAELSAATVED